VGADSHHPVPRGTARRMASLSYSCTVERASSVVAAIMHEGPSGFAGTGPLPKSCPVWSSNIQQAQLAGSSTGWPPLSALTFGVASKLQ
jgi:hypothetical protein